MFRQTMFFYPKLYIYQPEDISHELLFYHLPAISSLPLPHFTTSRLQASVMNSLKRISQETPVFFSGSKGHVCRL